MHHSTWKWYTAIFFCILILIPWFAQSAAAAQGDLYGYTLLENDAQRYTYKKLVTGIDGAVSSIQLDTEKHVTSADLSVAMNMVYADHPEFFWINGGYRYSHRDGWVISVSPNYTITGTTLQAAKAQLEAVVSAVLRSMPVSAKSDYDKALFLHDQLAVIVTYQYGDNDQTAYGALVEGKSVCAGYAKAYQLLMNRAGLPCWYVTGSALNSSTTVSHAWNMTWLDGVCCYTDVTWDDQDETLFHYYFSVSLEQISKTHTPKRPISEKCGHDTYHYFVKSAGKGVFDYTNTATATAAAQSFRVQSSDGSKETFSCAIRYHGNDYESWISSIVSELKALYDFNGYTSQCKQLGGEYQITVTANVPTQLPTDENVAPPTVPTAPPSLPATEPTTAPATSPTTTPTSVPTTAPTTVSTAPAQPSTAPTEPTTPTEPTKPTEPTEPIEPTIPTVPTETTEPVAPTESTAPTNGADPTESSSFDTPETTVPMTAENTDSLDTSAPDATEVTGSSAPATAPEPTPNKAEEDPEKQDPLLIIALSIVACGGVVVAVILIRKKHNA